MVNPHYRAVDHLHLAAMSLDHAMDELLLAASAAVAAQRGRVTEMFLAQFAGIVFVVAAVVAMTAVAEAASRRHIMQGGWSSRQHIYGAQHYAPWYERNQNENPDFQMVHD
jgi:hypothetical protein